MNVDAAILSDRTKQILARFEARADEIANRIASDTVAEVEGFGPINDARLFSEIRTLARRHLDAFVTVARSGGAPPPEVIAIARERARLRAREMVPLAALLHSYLIAQRVITAAIASEAEVDALSRGAALALVGKTFDYNIAVTAAMADAYVEVVQGDLAELDSARRSLIDALLTSEAGVWPALGRRASGLGFDIERDYVVALAIVDLLREGQPGPVTPRWAGQAIARSSGRPERSAFVVSRERDLVALLDASGAHPARTVLERAATTIRLAHGADLRAGVGGPFRGMGGFPASYRQARRALRYTGGGRPFVFWPDDVLLFDELTAASGETGAELIPGTTRRLLADGTMRATLEAFFAADLNVASAAAELSLHPNSLRYRLRRVAQITGRDPRRLADMVELMAAARLIAVTASDDER